MKISHKIQNFILLTLALVAGVGSVLIGSDSANVVQAELLGPLVTGAGVVTPFVRNYLHKFLVIDPIDTDLPIQGITVTIGGRVRIALSNQAQIQAFSKIVMQGLLGADVKVGMVIPLSNGFVANETVNIRLENAGATTPNCYFFSDSKGANIPIEASEFEMQASSSQGYDDFDALIFPEANFDRVDIQFADGFQDTWQAPELQAYLAKNMTTDANGELQGLLVLPNVKRSIRRAKVYGTNGGATLITQVNQIMKM